MSNHNDTPTRCDRGAPRPVLLVLAGALAISLACTSGGGINTRVTFRPVLIEPEEGSVGLGCDFNGGCFDTVRVTFNRAIDTTAVLDDEPPRYFLAFMDPPSAFVLDPDDVTLTNEMRTLVIPFQLQATTTYTFTLRDAQDTDGNPLQTTAETTFTVGSCTTPCP